jgi:hypothetical protein
MELVEPNVFPRIEPIYLRSISTATNTRMKCIEEEVSKDADDGSRNNKFLVYHVLHMH